MCLHDSLHELERHIPKVVSFIRWRYGSTLDAEDVVQEAAVRIIKRATGNRQEIVYEGGMYRLLVRTSFSTAFDLLRKQSKMFFGADPDRVIDRCPSIEDELTDPRISIAALKGIAGDLLSFSDWRVLGLFVAGHHARDIAYDLGISISGVGLIRHRAIVKLREYIASGKATPAEFISARRGPNKAGRPSKLSAEQRAEIIELVSTGTKTPAEAAQLFRIHRATVSRLLSQSGRSTRGTPLKKRSTRKRSC